MKPLTQEQQKEITISSILERLVLEHITPHLETFTPHLETFTPEYISNPFTNESWDCTFSSGETTNRFVSVCEMKIKQKYSIEDVKSALIKHNKYCSMISLSNTAKAQQKQTQPTYINVFHDGLVVFNLLHFEPALIKWEEKNWPRFQADWTNTRKEFIAELSFQKVIEKKKLQIPLQELKKEANKIYNTYHTTYPKHIPYFHINNPIWKSPDKNLY